MLDFLGGYNSARVPQDASHGTPAPMLRINTAEARQFLSTDPYRVARNPHAHGQRLETLPETRGAILTDCYVVDQGLANGLRAMHAKLPCAPTEDYIEFRSAQLTRSRVTPELALAVRNATMGDQLLRSYVRLMELHTGRVAEMHAKLGFPGPALGVVAVRDIPKRGTVLGAMTGEMLAVDPAVDATCRFNFNATIPEVPERVDDDESGAAVTSGASNVRMGARGDDDRSSAAAGTTAYHPDAHVYRDMWLNNGSVDLLLMYQAPAPMREMYLDTSEWVGVLNHVNSARECDGTQPNAICLDALVNGVAVVVVITVRPVEAGDEILLGYGDGYWRWHAEAMRMAGAGVALQSGGLGGVTAGAGLALDTGGLGGATTGNEMQRTSGLGGAAAGAGLAPHTGGLGGAAAGAGLAPHTGGLGGATEPGLAPHTGGLGGANKGNEMQRTGRGFTMDRSRSPSPRDVATAQLTPSEGEGDDMHAQNVRPGTVIDLSLDSDSEAGPATAAKPSPINLVSSSDSDGSS